MKEINIHNYEEHALEFINGELGEAEMDAFSEFLGKHPDIADDVLLFDLDQEIKQEPAHRFDGLKKNLTDLSINKHNFEEYCIASVEGDLDKANELKLQLYIGDNKTLQKEYKLFAQCKLIDEVMVFPNKENLKIKKKKAIFPRRTIGIASTIVAASVIAFILLLTPTGNTIEGEIATVSTIEKHQPIPEEIEDDTQAQDDKSAIASEKVHSNKKSPQKDNNKTKNRGIEKQNTKNTTLIAKTTIEPLPMLKHKRTTIPSYQIVMSGLDLIEPNYEQSALIANIDKDMKGKAKDYIYTTVLSKGIDGINKMTETELDYKLIEDENGEPIKMIIKSRFGEINRTLAQR